MFQNADLDVIMGEDERKELNAMDDSVTVYQGVTSYTSYNERSRSHKDISYDMFNGEDILVDHGTDVAVQTEQKMLLDKLRAVLPLLTDKEQRLIRALYFEGMTERQYAEQEGVYRNAIHKRKVRILAKLKKLLEK
ncbi:MAG: hypothetical protein J1E00_06000 [Oscillospiraceae bacterium]|nr:hypothetical protein [Oscillospiraceae bacterium]